MTREDYEAHKEDYKDNNESSSAFVLIQDVYIRILEAQMKAKDDEIELLKYRIEEAMKPKTCLGCLHCNKAYQLTSCPPQYELNCGVFKTVFVNDFKQYCSRYEPKVTP